VRPALREHDSTPSQSFCLTTQAASEAQKKDSHWLFLCCFALLGALDAELIGDVVLEDVAHELHGFPPDSLCGHYLDVVEPFIRIEAPRGRLPPQLLHAGRPGIVGGKREELAVQWVDTGVVEVFSDQDTQILHTRVDIGLGEMNIPDVHAGRPGGFGHHLHDPYRPRTAADRLV
jgi:hypothetical protein